MFLNRSFAAASSLPLRQLLKISPLLLLGLSIQACSGSHELAQYASNRGTGVYTRDALLARKIDDFLPDTLFPPSNIGLVIGTLNDGRILYERNADMLFTPASNQKLFTSAAALSSLGPMYQFQTTVAIDSAHARIYLRGAGDPLLTTTDLEELAASTLLRLPFRPAWTVVGEPGRFDSVYWGRGWMWDDAADPSGMGVSALTVNSNTIDLHVVAGDSAGTTPTVSLVPPSDYVRIVNQVTVADSIVRPLEATRALQHPSNVITLHGEVTRDSHHTLTVAVWEPDRYMTALFADAVRRLGVRVSEIDIDTVQSAASPAAVVTHRLDSIVTYMNKVSDNLSAECLLKTLGAVTSSTAGSWQNGTHAVRTYLESLQIDTSKLVIADGSGLSRYNLTTTGTIFRILKAMHDRTDLWPVFAGSLPVAGRDGTLEHRMRGTIAESRVHAKTGSISGVSSLSGFIEAAGGQFLGFSMIMENVPGSVAGLRAVQDSIATFLVSYHPPGPPVP